MCNGQHKPNTRRKNKVLNGLEGLLQIASLDITTKSVGAGTYSKNWRERVSDFRSCNAETAATEWSANKRNREQIGVWQPERI